MTSFNNTVQFQRERLETKAADYPYTGLIDGYLKSFDAQEAESRYLGSTYVISRDGGYTFGPVKRSPVTSIHGPCVRGSETLYIGRDYRGRFHGEKLLCCTLDENDDFRVISNRSGGCARRDGTGLRAARRSHARQQHCRMHSRAVAGIFTLYQCDRLTAGAVSLRRTVSSLTAARQAPAAARQRCAICTRLPPRTVRSARDVQREFRKAWAKIIFFRATAPRKTSVTCTVELLNGSLLSVYYQRPARHESAVIMQSIWRLPEDI